MTLGSSLIRNSELPQTPLFFLAFTLEFGDFPSRNSYADLLSFYAVYDFY
jgi:hypothetical protein